MCYDVELASPSKVCVFLLFLLSRGACFLVFPPPFPEEEISDCIAHGPIIQVFTVSMSKHPADLHYRWWEMGEKGNCENIKGI